MSIRYYHRQNLQISDCSIIMNILLINILKKVDLVLTLEEFHLIPHVCNKWTKIRCGIPQGLILGLLFSIYLLMIYS